MIDVRLKRVVSASFNKGCHTQLEDFRRASKANHKFITELKPSEAIMFLSLGEDQLRFCYKPIEAERSALLESSAGWCADRVYTGYIWLQIRLSGRWNPLMLASIAQRAGINLVGIEHFEEYYEYLLTEERTRRREAKRRTAR
jgi:hypothetical protein